MSDIDGWIYFDGPEPDHIRPLLDALRDLSPATPDDKERLSRRFFETLDAQLSQRSSLPVATGSQLVQAPNERRAGEEGASTPSPAFDNRHAALLADPPEPYLIPIYAEEPHAAEGRAPEVLTSTALAMELSPEVREQLGRLPFKPREPGNELKRTMQVPVIDWRKGQTEPIVDNSIAKAVPALPFAGNTVGQGVVPFPRLSLQGYASLRAELSVWPEHSANILPRYHVMNEAARRALDEHWQMQLAASPELRAQLEKALAEYTNWLRTRRL